MIKIKKENINQKKGSLYTEMLYKARNSVIKFFDDYSSIVSESKFKSIYGEVIKISISKQILQRLPIVLVQVKKGLMHQKTY